MPADEVEEREACMPQPILDAVAEDPQIEQIPKDMDPAAVQEHGGEQRITPHDDRDPCELPCQDEPERDEPVPHEKGMQPLGKRQLIAKDKHIRGD